VRARRARPADAIAIHALIARYAAQGLLLPRTEEEIRAHIARFLVLAEQEHVLGCVALEPYGDDLAEIRSVAVDDQTRGKGLGGRLVQYALTEAKRRGFLRVFAVTHAPDFFQRQGFALSHRRALPEKIERDCRTCHKQRTCHLAALVAVVSSERAALPVLSSAATA
jgi:N-acetylglutamate synthase-like GNAT family acetyltransferase